MKIETSQSVQKHLSGRYSKELATEFEPRKLTKLNNERILLFGRISAIFGVVMVLVLLTSKLYAWGMLVAAVLCGMAESQGRCGVSHIGSIAPIKPIDSKTWVKCCLAYSLCGMVTAYLVGLLIVSLGTWFNVVVTEYYLGVICLVCIVFFLRDLGWLHFTPPQCNRQTHKVWAMDFGVVTGAGMWGAHIGLAVTTVVTYGGLYCLLLVAFDSGVGIGAWLLVAFWSGRVVFLWVTPWLMNSSSNGMKMGMALERSGSMFRLCSLCGIASIFVLSLTTLYAGLL